MTVPKSDLVPLVPALVRALSGLVPGVVHEVAGEHGLGAVRAPMDTHDYASHAAAAQRPAVRLQRAPYG
jgi:hypothetical protein